MTLPRPCLSVLRHRPVYRDPARTSYHAYRIRVLRLSELSDPAPNGFVLPGDQRAISLELCEGRFRGRRLAFPGPKGICITVLCCDWLRRASRELYPLSPISPFPGENPPKRESGMVICPQAGAGQAL